jgi:hypothetical protein
MLLDPDRIPNTDPDPRQPNQCGSIRIRIHNSGSSCWKLSPNKESVFAQFIGMVC